MGRVPPLPNQSIYYRLLSIATVPIYFSLITGQNRFLLLVIIGYFLNAVRAFELDTSSNTVECVQCVQLWRSASVRESKACGPQAQTCRGDACFMRQCKHCPVYQYMSGCIQLTPWQIADIEVNRRSAELRMRRVGAELLCEDSFNQTTCICNRRDKCNAIHARVPFSTYAEGLFKGVVDFDAVIGALDPRYLEVISGYHYRFSGNSSSSLILHFVVLLYILVMIS